MIVCAALGRIAASWLTTMALACACPGCSGPAKATVAPPAPASVPRDGPTGAWVNVTPAGIDLTPTNNNGNYGVQDVVADPVRSNELYAFVCLQGVWKSTDYGVTWRKIDAGAGSAHLDGGRPWGVAIDPNPRRDAATLPTMFTAAGAGDLLGVYKSTDGGVSWTIRSTHNASVIASAGGNGVAGDDVYSFDIDPHDPRHVIAGFHGYPGLSESTDGGDTWRTVPVPAAIGESLYAWFINTGSPFTTSTTWLTMSGAHGKVDGGVWRTTDRGGTWARVQSSLQHAHGASQIHQAGHGVIYAAGVGDDESIWRSTDYGATWLPANGGGVRQNAIFASATTLYAMGFAGNVEMAPSFLHLQRSPVRDGLRWSDWTPISPIGMNNGVKRVAVTSDGRHFIFVSGNWLVGIWRYVEP